MDVEDDLKDLKESDLKLPPELDKEEELRRQKRKKIIVAATGLFLAVLFVVYLVPGNYVLYILEGQATSYKLNSDLTIVLKEGKKIIFDNSTYEKLKQEYFAEQRNEFKACLEGRKEGLTYYVTGIKIPKTFSQSFSHVSAEMCDENTIVSLHTHPFKHCIFSYQDIRNYDAVRAVNKDTIIGLMCETDRFNFYGF